MDVEAIPLTNFVHGHFECRMNRPVMMPAGVADDLEKAGLIRIALKRTAAPIVSGKAQDDGQGQPSSASQAAPASQPTTSQPSKRGAAKAAKTDA